jgi:hypothetical protein
VRQYGQAVSKGGRSTYLYKPCDLVRQSLVPHGVKRWVVGAREWDHVSLGSGLGCHKVWVGGCSSVARECMMVRDEGEK